MPSLPHDPRSRSKSRSLPFSCSAECRMKACTLTPGHRRTVLLRPRKITPGKTTLHPGLITLHPRTSPLLSPPPLSHPLPHAFTAQRRLTSPTVGPPLHTPLSLHLPLPLPPPRLPPRLRSGGGLVQPRPPPALLSRFGKKSTSLVPASLPSQPYMDKARWKSPPPLRVTGLGSVEWSDGTAGLCSARYSPAALAMQVYLSGISGREEAYSAAGRSKLRPLPPGAFSPPSPPFTRANEDAGWVFTRALFPTLILGRGLHATGIVSGPLAF